MTKHKDPSAIELGSGTDSPAPANPQERLVSLDALRGFVMLAMASGGLGLARVADQDPENYLLAALGRNVEHVEWRGFTFWDLIQPAFMFMVGAALAFSLEKRRAEGQSTWALFKHALWRSVALIALGVFLDSNGRSQTNWSFVNVLTQIGLGYMVLFFLALTRKWAVQVIFAFAILVAHWCFFFQYSVPEAPAYNKLGVSSEYKPLEGIQKHWNKNVNAASAFDVWFLNKLPRPDAAKFEYNEGGYTTLNFIPSISTMLFGLAAAALLRSPKSSSGKLQLLLISGAIMFALGYALDLTFCPSVKRIWTPAWVCTSTGLVLWMLGLFYGLFDSWKLKWLAFPLAIVGMNSILMYVMAQLMKPWIRSSLRTHLNTLFYFLESAGVNMSNVPSIQKEGFLFSGKYGPVYEASAVLFVLWLICLWLYRRKIFVRV